jgi:Leucine-rich repeat (LRR) protein
MKNYIIVLLIVVIAGLGYVVAIRDDSSQKTTTNDIQEPAGQTGANTKSLADSGIETVPQSTFKDDSITVLDVSGNNLTGALPSELQKLKNLEILDASDNNFTGIPAEIGQLARLRVANFVNNDISGLPMELAKLSNLEKLDLRGNPNISKQDLSQIRQKLPKTEILID